MNAQNELQHRLPKKPLGRFVLQGAGIALLLETISIAIMFTIGGVLIGKTFWEGVWQFFPLVTVTAGGALGGMIYYLLVQKRQLSGWKKVMAVIFSVLFYIVLIWLSSIIGFSATGQWD